MNGCVCGHLIFIEAATVLSWQKKTVSSQRKRWGNWAARVQLEAGLCVAQSLSHVQLFTTPWAAARQASLSITDCWSLLKLMSVE